jgi:hypothetical protein
MSINSKETVAWEFEETTTADELGSSHGMLCPRVAQIGSISSFTTWKRNPEIPEPGHDVIDRDPMRQFPSF